MAERGHNEWLHFVKKAVDLPIGYSAEDLAWFAEVASQQYPSLVPIIEACITLVRVEASGKARPNGASAGRAHDTRRAAKAVWDLQSTLSDTGIFPKNLHLVEVARQVMPDLKDARFDKMSRADIVKLILRHLSSIDQKARYRAESVFRSLAETARDLPAGEREPSFVSRWENVIKSMRL